MNYKELFVYFITEREDIRILKDAGFEKPWTDDSLLATTRFTNINRENDKVTRFIRAHVNYDEELYAKIYLSRIYNVIESLELVDWSQPIEIICNDYLRMLATRKILTSNAYMLTSRIKHNPGECRALFYTKRCVEMLEQFKRLNSIVRCEDCYTAILNIPDIGVGSFLAGQIIADAKNTKGSNLYDASDKFVFVCHGPGSMHGLSYYTGIKITPSNFYSEINVAFRECTEELTKLWREDIINQLDMQNFQNCFCEFSKYCKLLDKPTAKHRVYD